jgi:hypothetical protein
MSTSSRTSARAGVLIDRTATVNNTDSSNHINKRSSTATATVKCQKVRIPLMSSAESLNASVACAVILGEARRQRK